MSKSGIPVMQQREGYETGAFKMLFKAFDPPKPLQFVPAKKKTVRRDGCVFGFFRA